MDGVNDALFNAAPNIQQTTAQNSAVTPNNVSSTTKNITELKVDPHNKNTSKTELTFDVGYTLANTHVNDKSRSLLQLNKQTGTAKTLRPALGRRSVKTHMQLRAARSRCTKRMDDKYCIPWPTWSAIFNRRSTVMSYNTITPSKLMYKRSLPQAFSPPYLSRGYTRIGRASMFVLRTHQPTHKCKQTQTISLHNNLLI